MTKTSVTLPSHAATFGWRNRILRVDLSERRIWAQESAYLTPDYLGARGFAAKLLWDEYPQPVDAFHPDNPFMVFPGALTGSRSPYSGRTIIAGFSPQSHPYTWFTRSSIGANFGDELKRAGYDGLVVTAASDEPVSIVIHDDDVSIVFTPQLWWRDTIETQEQIQDEYGKRARVLTIGVAGELLSRIATVQTDTTSVAGQGGFGAVMGSKKLKAVAVIGSTPVPLAEPDKIRDMTRAIAREYGNLRGGRRDLSGMNEQLAAEGGGKVRITSCTASCPTPCRLSVDGIQGCHFDRKWSGGMACVSGIFRGGYRNSLYDWDFGFRGGFELQMYANRLGLNHWEVIIGMYPWLRTATRQGLFDTFNGSEVNWQSEDWHVQFLHDVAHRVGMGDALAEGSVRAAPMLGLAPEVMRRYYTGWGYAGHWDGHACFSNTLVYPFWIPGAIHWAMDTRDPASSTHGYVQNVMYWGPFGGFYKNDDAQISWEQMKAIGHRVYGHESTLDPLSDYEHKAVPAAYHGLRSVMKDCLPTDDQMFPLIYSHKSEDRFARLNGVDGPDVDSHLFRAGTGIDWSPDQFTQAAERVLNLERAIVIRHYGRDRQMDERVLPAFEYDENWVNTERGERMKLDRQAFDPVMDDYLRLRGWDVDSGWPTQETLDRLDLGDLYDDMVAGAAEAKDRLEPLPEETPIIDHHANDPDRSES